ncbi:tryptophan 7-halogenase [Sphingomonas sp. SM33]|uniref:Tryptophan 7-halogenase n=1 Tax=Sphingomonas telluris TaxID=2907998 RepID=A0ABS9VMC7_9SPHN|nr:tryptophan halogenase family protein [Sphingomonas telluris]MCH8616126.1 tryptophan 7-halogenase [Sphingomonas telluris]
MAGGDQPVRKVTIVGGGTAGWMTAAVLSQWLSQVEIKLVESEEIGTVGVGEATIPHIRNYLPLAGVDPLKMIHATKATFKLGIQFVDWGAPGESYFHGFGNIGRDMLWLHAHQLWLAANERAPGSVKHFDNYSIAAAAALRNRFDYPDKRNPNSPLADFEYAYNFDASLFARFLRAESEARGVQRIEGRVVEVLKDGQSGFVSGVRLQDGRELAGDLFVDCSGMRALLIGDTLGVGYEHWNKWLICDRALAVPCESVSPVTPYVRCTTRSAGWQWRIPLQHRIGNGYVYSSNLLSDDEAAETLLGNLDGTPLADARPVRFAPGRRLKAWDKNVVSIGLSSGFLEPLESTSIHLIQTGIQKLLALFPATGFSQPDIDEYNRQARFEFEDVRDFIIAHYNVTRRSGEPFWDYVRMMDVPDSLKERYELFASSGRFFKRAAAELFAENSWVQVLLGQGFQARPDPVAQFVPTEEIVSFLEDVADTIADVAEELPDHADFVSRLPTSTPGAQQGPSAALMHNLAEVHRE